MNITPVILSGGSGTRLWPLSRELYPKQLLALAGDKTLLQQTILRLSDAKNTNPPIIVCNEAHRFLVAEQLREIDVVPQAIILEPVGRNTAPALVLAARAIQAHDQNALMLAMPADHIILDINAYLETVDSARFLAQKGRLVTFGIVPDSPATGFGYIKQGTEYRVERFVEKPPLEQAREYLQSGDYLWNSGIFMMSPSSYLDELGQFSPAILHAANKAYDAGVYDLDFFRIDKALFEQCPADSIDYAVMENTANAAVVPLDASWSDIGAWSSLWSVSGQDEAGNVLVGDVHAEDTQNSLLMADSRLVASIGLRDIVVVETADAVLVCHRDRAEDVKTIVTRIKAAGRSEHETHTRVYRPWGDFEGIDQGSRYQVKRLTVKPGASLSLQLHHHRAEHWVVVSGTARVTRGEDVLTLCENESVYIPIGTKHRLENPGTIPLEIIEVQSGSYLGEDDIVRFEDVYNRVEK